MDITKLSDEELKIHLEEIRSRRKTGYSPRKKSKPKKDEIVLESLIGLDDDIASKILNDLLKDSKD